MAEVSSEKELRQPLFSPDAEGDFQPVKQHSRKVCCFGKLTSRGCCYLATVLTIVITLGVVLGVVFGLGRKYAEVAINDSDISMTMTLSNPTDTGFDVHAVGTIDNRNVLDAHLDSTTMYLGLSQEGTFGKMPFPALDLGGGGITTFDVSATVVVTDTDVFTKFATAVSTTREVFLTVHSDVDIKAAGVSYSSISFDKVLTIPGLNNFHDPPLVIAHQSINKGTPTTLYASMDVTMENPSTVAFANLGQMDMDMYVNDVKIGHAFLPDFTLPYGTHTVEWQAEITKTAENADAISAVLSAYSSGKTLSVNLRGHAGSTPVKLLQPAFQALNVTTSLPGLFHAEDHVMQVVHSPLKLTTAFKPLTYPSVCNYTTSPSISPYGVEVTAFVKNTMNTTLTVNSTDLDVYWMNPPLTTALFMAHSRGRGLNHVSPAGGLTTMQQMLCLTVDLPQQAILEQMLTYGTKPWDLATHVNGTMSGTVGDFPFTIQHFEQSFITVAQVFQESQWNCTAAALKAA